MYFEYTWCLLVLTTFLTLQEIVALACDLGLDSLPTCVEAHKWSWFRRYSAAARVAMALERRVILPTGFCEEVSSDASCFDLFVHIGTGDVEHISVRKQSLIMLDQPYQGWVHYFWPVHYWLVVESVTLCAMIYEGACYLSAGDEKGAGAVSRGRETLKRTWDPQSI